MLKLVQKVIRTKIYIFLNLNLHIVTSYFLLYADGIFDFTQNFLQEEI